MLKPWPRANDLTEGNRLHRRHWPDWLQNLFDTVNAAAERIQHVALVDQEATVNATPIPLQEYKAGLFRVTWYLRVTRAAATSSSLQVFLAWEDGGVTCGTDFPAIAGNTTGTQSSGTYLIKTDAEPIEYAITYASVGSPSAAFAFDLILERMS